MGFYAHWIDKGFGGARQATPDRRDGIETDYIAQPPCLAALMDQSLQSRFGAAVSRNPAEQDGPMSERVTAARSLVVNARCRICRRRSGALTQGPLIEEWL
jgi:hypothetical protein